MLTRLEGVVAVLVLLAGAAVGCGGDQKDAKTQNDRAASEPEPDFSAFEGDGMTSKDGRAVTTRDGRVISVARLAEPHTQSAVPTATLPGFRMMPEGRSRVFLEVTGQPAVGEPVQNGRRISIRLTGVHVPERVNRLALPTQHFETPVAEVKLVQVGADADLLVLLRHDVTNAKHHVEHSGSGTVVSIDFPALP